MGKTNVNKYNQYSREALEKAIKAVKEHGMTCSGAAKDFGVPRKTLSDHVSGRSTLTRKAGRECNIPIDIENAIVDKVIMAGRAGFPTTKSQFLLKVSTVVKRLGLKTQFKDDLPGKDYWYGLKKRRPDIAIRVAQNCPSNRLMMMTRPVINRYFDDLKKLVTKLNLDHKPECIWNCDETGLQFSPDSSKVLAEKGDRTVFSRCSPSKESVTTLVCINAAGQAMPPLCVVKGKTQKSLQSFATQDGPEGTIWTFQSNAWMDDDIGQQWFRQVFLAYCGSARPQLLILDSHHSHEVLEMLELAQQEDIHIMALPPHTTHALQPLDKVVFKPFKTAYKRVCTEFRTSHPNSTINKATWPRLLKQTWDSTLREILLKKALEATGIYPINRSRIPDSLHHASDAVRRMIPVVEASSDNHDGDGTTDDSPATHGTKDDTHATHGTKDDTPATHGTKDDTPATHGTKDDTHATHGTKDDTPATHGTKDDTHATHGTKDDTPEPPVVSFDNMEELQFLNELMTDITEEDIEQAVGVSNVDQLVDAMPSPTATPTVQATTTGVPSVVAVHSAPSPASSSQSNWNAEIEAIFDLRPNKITTPKRSRAIATHRLLTSQDLIDEKRARLEKKEKEEAAKQERKQRALQKKLAKAQKTSTQLK